MQRLEVSGVVRPIYGSLGGKRLVIVVYCIEQNTQVELLCVAVAQSCNVKEATNCNHCT